MKRSRSVRLILLGGLSAGALAGCDPAPSHVVSSGVYTNNHHVPGMGYYHAPFNGWYSLPYNYYEPKSAKYFYGGQWGAAPHQSIVNISTPSPEAARELAARQSAVRRSGFGSTSRHFSSFSS